MTYHAAPDREILRLVRLGVAAISADVDILDDLLFGVPDDELVEAKAAWTDTPPDVFAGHARRDTAMPCYAVTVAQEASTADYVGGGDEAFLDGDEVVGSEQHWRVSGSYAVFVYALHPDVCAWYYRALRAILRAATDAYPALGIDCQSLTGTELVPDPRYSPANLHVRKVLVTVEFEEVLANADGTGAAKLRAALCGDPEARLGSLSVAHEDSGGGVEPYEV